MVYNTSIPLGPGTTSFWIGITGTTPRARYVPFRLETTVQETTG
jgi:hypothetical protein